MSRSDPAEPAGPDIEEISSTLTAIHSYLVETPSVTWQGGELAKLMEGDGRVVLKLELLQRTGSFKARGAMTAALSLDADRLRCGVTAASSGNHAIATAYAALQLGTTAKVAMLASANPARIERCRRLGAEVVIAGSGSEAFKLAEHFVATEGRTLIHPYESRSAVLGSGTLGIELSRQGGALDAVVIPIGGGGLCAGVANALKQLQPNIRVYGVEPAGANLMHRSLNAGRPLEATQITTIADSLGAPFAGRYTFELCRRYLNDVVLVSDDEIRFAMGLLFREWKLAVEPAAAAATAALIGPLRSTLVGKNVGVVICGSNIDFPTYAGHIAAAPSRRPAPIPVGGLVSC
jgi:threonine dehydratase